MKETKERENLGAQKSRARWSKSLAASLVLHVIAVVILALVGVQFGKNTPETIVQVEVLTPQKTTQLAKSSEPLETSAAAKSSTSPIDAAAKAEPRKHNQAQARKSTEPVTSAPKAQSSVSDTKEKAASETSSPTEDTSATQGGASASRGTQGGSSTGKEGEGGGKEEGPKATPDRSQGPSGRAEGHYDRAVAQKSIQGSVTVRALLGADGRVQSASVVSSSGYSAIDNMGLRDIYGGRYTPRRDKNGKPTACYITQTFTYRLR